MAQRFVLGKNNAQAPNEFEINPNLQRTQNGEPSVRQGLTLGTTVFDYKIKQSNQIVLKNRAVPFNNSKGNVLKKVPENIINLLQVPTEESKGNFSQSKGVGKGV